MIGIFVQGSIKLGLGHLSRVVPLYHFLRSRDLEVRVFFYGDTLGQNYLSFNSVEFQSFNLNDEVSSSIDFWIFDTTDFYFNHSSSTFLNSQARILLSPNFNCNKASSFTHAVIRSDPYLLPIKNKYVSPYYFSFSDGRFGKSGYGLRLGVALSGSNCNSTIERIINKVLSDTRLIEKVELVRIFSTGTTDFDLNRIQNNAYSVSIEIISSLNSLWCFAEDLNLMIVGNGLIIDECILKSKNFFVFDESVDFIPKTGFPEFMKGNVCQNVDCISSILVDKYYSLSKSFKQVRDIKYEGDIFYQFFQKILSILGVSSNES